MTAKKRRTAQPYSQKPKPVEVMKASEPEVAAVEKVAKEVFHPLADLRLWEESTLDTKVVGRYTESLKVVKVPGGHIYKFYWGETLVPTQVTLLGTTFVPA